MGEFGDWLMAELERRGLTQADLSRMAHISSAQVANVVNGDRQAGDKFCRAVARAFDLPQTEVFRLAKLLDDEPDTNPLTDRLLAIAAQLSEDEMRDLLDYAELIKRRRKRKGGGDA